MNISFLWILENRFVDQFSVLYTVVLGLVHKRMWSESQSLEKVVSDSLQHYGLYSLWNSPGQNTGVGRVAFPFSRGSSQPRDRTQVSCIAGRFFIVWPSREALMISSNPRVFGPWIQLGSVMSDHKLFIWSISWVYYHHFHPKVCWWTWYLCFLNLKIGFIFLKQQCYPKWVLSI